MRNDPLKQALLVQYLDQFINKNMRIKFGDKFPFFLIDICESEKKYFLLELTKQPVISDIFLTDIQNMECKNFHQPKIMGKCNDGCKRNPCNFYRLWRATTVYHHQRILEFKAVDKLASNEEIIRSGVEVPPIVKLLVRSHNFISLECCDSDSPIRKYVKKDDVLHQYITSNDLVIKIDKSVIVFVGSLALQDNSVLASVESVLT